MINSVDIDLLAFEASQKEAEKVIEKIGQTPARKVIIDAGNEGMISALRKHFALREKELPMSSCCLLYGGILMPLKRSVKPASCCR